MKEQLADRRADQVGEEPLGWSRFGAPAAMEKLKIMAPLVGFLISVGSLPQGTASLSGWVAGTGRRSR
jgi:hypothetical protein